MHQLNESAGFPASTASEATAGKQQPQRARNEFARGRPFDHENTLRWQDAQDARRRLWWKRKAEGLQPGPWPGSRTNWRGPRARTAYFVAIDRRLAASTPVRFFGEEGSSYVVGPEGATLRGDAIAGPLFSRGQARKALRAALRRHPGAWIKKCSWYPDDADCRSFSGGSIDFEQLVKVDAA